MFIDLNRLFSQVSDVAHGSLVSFLFFCFCFVSLPFILLNTKEGLQPPKNHMNLDPPTDIIIFRQNYNISKYLRNESNIFSVGRGIKKWTVKHRCCKDFSFFFRLIARLFNFHYISTKKTIILTNHLNFLTSQNKPYTITLINIKW